MNTFCPHQIDHSSSAMDKLKALFEGEKEEPKKKGFRLPWEKEAKPDPKKGKFSGLKGMQTKTWSN